PPLARFARRPAYAFADGSLAEWTLRVTRRELPSLLYHAASQRLSGVIRVDVKGPGRRLFLVGGQARFVASSEPAELLGARLLAAGLLKPQELSRAVCLGCERGQLL